jgi:predicted ATP-binding protein involved in virulence
MGKTRIKSFEIFGLFGTDDINIPFNEDGIKILIGENGLGKTQLLNLFYYTLTANFFRLSEYKFSKLKLSLTNKKVIEISKTDIDDFTEKIYKHPIVKDFINDFSIHQFEMLRKNIRRIEKSCADT